MTQDVFAARALLLLAGLACSVAAPWPVLAQEVEAPTHTDPGAVRALTTNDATPSGRVTRADDAAGSGEAAKARIPTAGALGSDAAKSTDGDAESTRKLRVAGLVQLWYGTAFGSTLGGNNPTNSSPTPQGRNFGGGHGDLFRLRRAQISLDGRISGTFNYHTMIDFAQTGAGTLRPVQDLWVGARLDRNLLLEIGQQKTGLSDEASQDNAQLLTIARSIMNEDVPAKAGNVGNLRDAGAVLKLRTSRIRASVGIWNNNGPSAGTADTDQFKFASGTFYVSTLRHFTFGVWGGTNFGGSRNSERRDRLGGTFLFESGPHTLEIEGAYARDIAAGAAPGKPGTIAVGWYALYAHRISRKWQLVARYNIWDPAQHDTGPATTVTGVLIPQGDHKTKEYTLGVNYNITDSGSRIQVNYIREDVEKNGIGFFGVPRNILLTNFQTTF